MGDLVLGLGEGLALGCTHPSLCSPEGLGTATSEKTRSFH